jgi:hypothetical protein
MAYYISLEFVYLMAFRIVHLHSITPTYQTFNSYSNLRDVIKVFHVNNDVILISLLYNAYGMWHEWGRRGMHIGYWWESQKERDP